MKPPRLVNFAPVEAIIKNLFTVYLPGTLAAIALIAIMFLVLKVAPRMFDLLILGVIVFALVLGLFAFLFGG